MLKEINESKFSMWRAIVALVFADGHAHPEERKFLEESFDRLPLNQGQINTLKKDLAEPQDVTLLFENIADNADRSQFIYFARLLFWSDGDFHKQEEKIFELLRAKTLERVDLVKAMKDVDKVAQQFQVRSGNKGFREILAELVERFVA